MVAFGMDVVASGYQGQIRIFGGTKSRTISGVIGALPAR
jgi:hypothetical protein